MRGFESQWLSTAGDLAWAQLQVPYDCPMPVDSEDRYWLRELIGIGPRSWVYLADDRKLSTATFQARVVVKISREAGGREAELARRIEHPDVPAILDRGVTALGHAYVVVEWVDAAGLDKSGGGWETVRAARFIVRLGRVIEAAHARGIVHCDLKPDNVLLGPEDRPVLIDFDLAAALADGKEGESRGNLGYMSPEQFRQEAGALAPQADVYGLGGLLVFLTTGKAANGSNVAEAEAFLSAGASWAGRVGDADLTAIAVRALAFDRAERYASVSALVDDVQRWLDRESIAWRNPSAGRRLGLWMRRRPVAAVLSAIAALAVVGGVGGGFAWQRYEADRAVETLKEVNRRAEAEIDRLKAGGRTRMLDLARKLFGNREGDQRDSAASDIVLASWLVDQELTFKDGKIPLPAERIAALRQAVERAVAHGQEDAIPTLMQRIALAIILIRDEQYSQGREIAVSASTQWGPRLNPRDPVHVILETIDLCGRIGIGSDVAPQEITDLKNRLKELDAPASVTDLLTRTAARAKNPATSGASR